MRNARRKQGQRLHTFALDGFKRFLPRLGGIVEDQRHTGTAFGFAIQRRGVEPEKAFARIKNFKLMPGDVCAAGAVGAGNFLPVHLRQKLGDVQVLLARLQADELRDGLVEINHSPGFVHHEHAVFDGIEEGFKEAPLASEALDDSLQSLCVQPPDAAKHFIKKTGFSCCHWLIQQFNGGKLAQLNYSSNQKSA